MTNHEPYTPLPDTFPQTDQESVGAFRRITTGLTLSAAVLAPTSLALPAAAEAAPTVAMSAANSEDCADHVDEGAIAHRGIGIGDFHYKGKTYQEDTSAAALLGLRLGAGGTEFDVRQTKDKKTIVLHDAGFARISDGVGLASKQKLSHIRKYRNDNGTRFETTTEFMEAIAPTVNQDCDEVLAELKSGLSKKAMKKFVHDNNTLFKDPSLVTITSNSFAALNQFNVADDDRHDTAKIVTGIKQRISPAKVVKAGHGLVEYANLDRRAVDAQYIADMAVRGIIVATRNNTKATLNDSIKEGAGRIIFNVNEPQAYPLLRLHNLDAQLKPYN